MLRNPFSDETMIPQKQFENGHAEILLYVTRGVLVSVLFDGFLPAGDHETSLNAENLTPGIYSCRFISNSATESISMQIIR